MKSEYIFNTKKAKKDKRDYVVSVKSDNIPGTFEIKHNLPIRNQKNIGSCMSHAAVRAVEIQLSKKVKWRVDGSELYHYYVVRKEVNNTYPNDSGMTVRDGCKGIQKYGASLEFLCPYNTPSKS